MIKLIIFDLDGVLVNARELHYDALNRALAKVGEEYVINRDEHLSTYDGLPTTKKLNMLTKNKGLPKDKHEFVWQEKQRQTIKIIDEEMDYDNRIRAILFSLRAYGYRMAVASNSIRESVKMMLLRKGFMEYIDFFYSNQDVSSSKPNTEMYLKTMIKGGVNPNECLIIEDSHLGRKAALDSGAFLCAVKDTDDLTEEKIMEAINYAEGKSKEKPKWQGGNMNVLIPMAGAGSRFQDAGYTFPKPLIDVNEKPMIQVVVDNLNIDARHIFIVQREHYEKYNLKYMLNLISPGCEIIQTEGVTEGAACTTLLAKDLINNDEQLLIANSDQYMEWDSNNFMYSMVADGVDGGIATFDNTHIKWSYAELGEDGFVKRVAEKQPLPGGHATVGVYWFLRGSDYVKSAEQMIQKNIRFNKEFYVAPTINELIEDGKKIKIYNVNKMWGLGDPESLKYFLDNYEL